MDPLSKLGSSFGEESEKYPKENPMNPVTEPVLDADWCICPMKLSHCCLKCQEKYDQGLLKPPIDCPTVIANCCNKVYHQHCLSSSNKCPPCNKKFVEKTLFQ